jgi:quinol monooxygenase YgiN
MSGPFIWVGTYKVKPGKVAEAKQRIQELTDLVEANEPRLIAFNFYLDEENERVSCVQVHPDSASMAFHLEVIADHLSTAGEWLEKAEATEAYGTPPDGLIENERRWIDPRSLRLLPNHEAGFTRAGVPAR